MRWEDNCPQSSACIDSLAVAAEAVAFYIRAPSTASSNSTHKNCICRRKRRRTLFPRISYSTAPGLDILKTAAILARRALRAARVGQGVRKIRVSNTMAETNIIPVPTFANARLDAKKRQMPQCIAHRGFRARFPENSILAFEEAIKAGATAIETDLHLTQDSVVVVSHDPTLKRCFGRSEKIITRRWVELKDLRTTMEPHVPMPRLQDLLELLTRPGMEEIWILLDIKLSNDAETVMREIASAISQIPAPASSKPWDQRIVLGLWAAKFLPPAVKHLPGFPIMHIGFSPSYSRHFFSIPNIGLSMLTPMLLAPGGKRLMRECREDHRRQLLAWTVNEEDKMEWCIRRKLDGVITDDPTKFLAICESHDEYSSEPWMSLRFKSYFDVARVWIMITVLFRIFQRRFEPVASRELVQTRS